MKAHIIFCIIPIFIYAQKNMTPDTIFTVNNKIVPCILKSVSKSNIQVVVNSHNSGIGMKQVNKISFDNRGIIYNKESGFRFDLNQINQQLAIRNKKYNIESNLYADQINSFYFAAGFGSPQGIRYELGYTIKGSISFGLTYNQFDNWSQDPIEGQLGILFKVSFPNQFIKWSPYILYNHGRDFSVFGEPDKYNLFFIGSMVPIKSWLYIQPEIGVVFTSRHKYDPERDIKKTKMGFNLSLEFTR